MKIAIPNLMIMLETTIAALQKSIDEFMSQPEFVEQWDSYQRNPYLAMYPNGQYILAPQLSALATAQAALADLMLHEAQTRTAVIVNGPAALEDKQ